MAAAMKPMEPIEPMELIVEDLKEPNWGQYDYFKEYNKMHKQYNNHIFAKFMKKRIIRNQPQIDALIRNKLSGKKSVYHSTVFYEGNKYHINCYSRDVETNYYLIKHKNGYEWVNFDLIYMKTKMDDICFRYDELCNCDGRTYSYANSPRTLITSCEICIKLNIKIYEDVDVLECAVCLCNAKNTVFIPCGHFYTCSTCSPQLKTCPICRININERIDKSQFD